MTARSISHAPSRGSGPGQYRSPWLWWVAVCLWLAAITGFSSEAFGFEPMFRFLTPWLHHESPFTPDSVWAKGLLAVRKLAHFTEYAILALLTWTALRNRPGNRSALSRLIGIAAFCAAAALADEFHQTFVAGRTGQIKDSALDLFGSISMLAWIRFRSRRQKR